MKNCWDILYGGGGSGKDFLESTSEYCYEMTGGGGNSNSTFLELCGAGTDCHYGSKLRNWTECFGCVGLTNKKYCVLNNQLTKETYERVVGNIKKELGWGM